MFAEGIGNAGVGRVLFCQVHVRNLRIKRAGVASPGVLLLLGLDRPSRVETVIVISVRVGIGESVVFLAIELFVYLVDLALQCPRILEVLPRAGAYFSLSMMLELE